MSNEHVSLMRGQLEAEARKEVVAYLTSMTPMPKEFIGMTPFKKTNPDYVKYQEDIQNATDDTVDQLMKNRFSKDIEHLKKDIPCVAKMQCAQTIEQELEIAVKHSIDTKTALKDLVPYARKFQTLNEANKTRILERADCAVENVHTSDNPMKRMQEQMGASTPQEAINLRVPLRGSEEERKRPYNGLKQELADKGIEDTGYVAKTYLELAALSPSEKKAFFERLDQESNPKKKLQICQETALKVCENGLDLIQKGYISKPLQEEVAKNEMITKLNDKKNALEKELEIKEQEVPLHSTQAPASRGSITPTPEAENPEEMVDSHEKISKGLSRTNAVRGHRKPADKDAPSTKLNVVPGKSAEQPLKGADHSIA